MEMYEMIKDLGFGQYAEATLMKHKQTNELVAVKWLRRGDDIDEKVSREVMNHACLRHPNIVQFKEVALTRTHLAIVMEYAAGGDLCDFVSKFGRLNEYQARFLFQQLISGVSYCHSMGICHRDIKLDNLLLDGSSAFRLKICDFGLSKSSIFHSRPKSFVGTPAYIAPEIFSRKEYDGEMADVWSCGVTLYVMLTGQLPFVDQADPSNMCKIVQRIKTAQYNKLPAGVYLSRDCSHLLSHMLELNPLRRITVKDVKSHPWFLINLPKDLEVDHGSNVHICDQCKQNMINIVMEAKTDLTKEGQNANGSQENHQV